MSMALILVHHRAVQYAVPWTREESRTEKAHELIVRYAKLQVSPTAAVNKRSAKRRTTDGRNWSDLQGYLPLATKARISWSRIAFHVSSVRPAGEDGWATRHPRGKPCEAMRGHAMPCDAPWVPFWLWSCPSRGCWLYQCLRNTARTIVPGFASVPDACPCQRIGLGKTRGETLSALFLFLFSLRCVAVYANAWFL